MKADSNALYFAICKTGRVILPRLRITNFILPYTYKIATIFILVSINDEWNSRNSNFKSKNAKNLVRDRWNFIGASCY